MGEKCWQEEEESKEGSSSSSSSRRVMMAQPQPQPQPHKAEHYRFLFGVSLLSNGFLFLALLLLVDRKGIILPFTPFTFYQRAEALGSSTLVHPCSNRGYLVPATTTEGGSPSPSSSSSPSSSHQVCRCHTCFYGRTCSQRNPDCVIDLDHGDPTMYESFWQDRRLRKEATTVIMGWQRMSYFTEGGGLGKKSVCWFLEPELASAIRRLHTVTGNAVADESRHIVVGTGSTQLFQAALFAFCTTGRRAAAGAPVKVFSEAPYYSFHSITADFLESGIYQWAGDARRAGEKGLKEGEEYIEVVTSPNNPDGSIREPVIKGAGKQAMIIYDLAYYWPQYTPVYTAQDHDLMLFTVSKSTGHAGTRIGWALVKDEKVARAMTKFIEVSTIGASQVAQIRAADILNAVSKDCEKDNSNNDNCEKDNSNNDNSLFHKAYSTMEKRWQRLRSTVNDLGDQFSLPEFEPSHCNYFGKHTLPQPAFAWIRCRHTSDCEEYMRQQGIITRGGRYFGAGPEFTRMSMLDREDVIDLLIERLRNITGPLTVDPPHL